MNANKWVWIAAMVACALAVLLLALRLLGLLLTPWWVIVVLAIPVWALCALVVFAVLAWMAGGSH
jgi:hypothetical protein